MLLNTLPFMFCAGSSGSSEDADSTLASRVAFCLSMVHHSQASGSYHVCHCKHCLGVELDKRPVPCVSLGPTKKNKSNVLPRLEGGVGFRSKRLLKDICCQVMHEHIRH